MKQPNQEVYINLRENIELNSKILVCNDLNSMIWPSNNNSDGKELAWL